VSRKRKKQQRNFDSYEDRQEIKSSSRKKKQQRKSKRHFDKEALRGIMDGTINVDAYQDYVDSKQ
tara:strand:- start:634 stop:828 length:195 start_codon:yes stop_codon:yes gene_type:complete